MHSAILIVTSPLVLFMLLIVFFGISLAVNLTSGDFSVGGSGTHASSGLAVFLLLVLGISLLDIKISCRLLVDNNLLQAEFITIIFYALIQQGRNYIVNFDIK